MRDVTYTVHWSIRSGPVERTMPLTGFLLDSFYLMATTPAIPPLAVLNEFLMTGGDDGGPFQPGTTWPEFQLPPAEYNELVQDLQQLDIEDKRQYHPYILFGTKPFIDDELNRAAPDLVTWLDMVDQRYP